jgi:hypothetical protein
VGRKGLSQNGLSQNGYGLMMMMMMIQAIQALKVRGAVSRPLLPTRQG